MSTNTHPLFPKPTGPYRADGTTDEVTMLFGHHPAWCATDDESGVDPREHGTACERQVAGVQAQRADGEGEELWVDMRRPYLSGAYTQDWTCSFQAYFRIRK